MQIDNTPPSPDKIPAPATPTLQEVIASIKPALDAHPIEQKIPSTPLSKAEFEEAAEQARAAGLKVPPHPPEQILVGGEFVNRTSLLAGRVGIYKERRVLTILFRSTSKKLRSFIFYPSHRIDARELGKWIFWGVTGDVPENLVQSEIVSMDEFFRINACDFSALLKDPAIVYEVDKVRTELNKQIAEERAERRRLQANNDVLCTKLDEKNEAFEALAKNHEEETTRALRWQMACMALIVLGVVVAVGSRLLH
jgi:hypothetical protein